MRLWCIWIWIGLPAFVVQVLALVAAHEPSLDEIARRYTRRTAGGIHLPLVRRELPAALERRGTVAGIGVGNFADVGYTVLITIGGTTTPLILDTGSSDMWVMSDACLEGCSGNVRVYPQASFQYVGLDAAMFYGDSKTGTFATGVIGRDTVDLAGLKLQDHYFAAINQTNTTLVSLGAAGILGLGFPINSVIWNNVFLDKHDLESSSLSGRAETPLAHPNVKLGSPFPKVPFNRARFPTINSLLGTPHAAAERHAVRQVNSILSNAFESWSTLGPLLPRLVNTGALTSPMISVTLQRNTIDVGGNVGELSIGELPEGVSASELTWVPLRTYTYDEGGIPGPPDAPNETYPITWEVMLDDVYLDGEKLPRSTLSSSSIELSALVDTGNSLLRAPSDTVAFVQSKLGNGGLFRCNEPHTLSFEIGGKLFPVDPRDFINQAFENNVDSCYANLVATDPPRVGGYQFSWSLGTPFLKGVLSSYYFGNLSHPSQDKPRIGFLSTVPSNADALLQAAVAAAARANDNFPVITQAAPSGTASLGQTDSHGIPQATAAVSGARGSFAHLASSGPLGSLSFLVINALVSVASGLWLLGL